MSFKVSLFFALFNVNSSGYCCSRCTLLLQCSCEPGALITEFCLTLHVQPTHKWENFWWRTAMRYNSRATHCWLSDDNAKSRVVLIFPRQILCWISKRHIYNLNKHQQIESGLKNAFLYKCFDKTFVWCCLARLLLWGPAIRLWAEKMVFPGQMFDLNAHIVQLFILQDGRLWVPIVN